ncbi:LCP family protein [Streptomyces sp. SB3404]|uniref:LCP family protein n=2 Tax=Streptomyces boncukensis TaxID=2711219 RepID=A0A6G4WT74_9ACTN|nr:LCP family protein [Streptomyces boncukensis]
MDSRAGLSGAERDRLHVNGRACDCTDVMMLLHFSGDRRRISAVSIPRDSYVRFAPHRDKKGEAPTAHWGKINAAHRHGGPALAVRTVEQATGLRVHHYAEADFAGFVAAVDGLGGAEVCTRKPMWDENAGLDLAAGEHALSGGDALRFVRARHVPPPGDLGRVRRQQQLVAGVLLRLAGERADDPSALLRAARTLRRTVRTDEGLTRQQLLRLGGRLRGLSARRMEFATVPIADFDHRVASWGSTLAWDDRRARALFRALAEDRPLTRDRALAPPPGVRPVAVDPGLVPVRVVGEGRESARVERALRRNGFSVAGRGGGRRAEGRTVISYAPGYDGYARVLAAALPQARTRPVVGHSRTLTVRPGAGRVRLARIVHDRSSVEGAPVTAKDLACP